MSRERSNINNMFDKQKNVTKVAFKTGSQKVSGKEIVELVDIKNYLFNYFILFHN